MNGQDPNLNNKTNNSNAMPSNLGMAPNVNSGASSTVASPMPNTNVNVPMPESLPNVAPNTQGVVENLNQEQTPVAQPIPGTEGLTLNTVGANNNFTPSSSINNFTSANKMENIGAVPPLNTPPKKKGMNKILFVLLILILIAGVAFGVYYFLNISNSSMKLTPKTVNIGVGETVPDDIGKYVDVTKGDISNCSLNTKNVDIQTIGEYDVTITCGKEEFIAKVIVSDKTAPVAVVNDVVFKTLNSEITTQDFVKSCTDESKCNTVFADETKIQEYIKTAGGPYEVSIKAVDEASNEAIYTSTLYVTTSDIFLFANFTSKEENLTTFKAKKVQTDVFAINKSLAFLNAARRDYKYTFESETEYMEVVGEKENTITFEGVSGAAIYDDKNLSFTITNDLSLDVLKSENNGAFPETYQEIQAIYKAKEFTPTFVKGYHQEQGDTEEE